MAVRTLTPASRSLRIALLVAGLAGLATGVVAWVQVEQERRIDDDDMHRRAHALAHQVSGAVRRSLEQPDPALAAESLSADLGGYRRLIGFAVFLPDRRVYAAGEGAAEFLGELGGPVSRALGRNTEVTETFRAPDAYLHILASPIAKPDGSPAAVLVVLHDATHLVERTTSRLLRSTFWVVGITLLIMTMILAATWAAYDRPLRNLAEWMRRVRTGDEGAEPPPVGLPVDLLASESSRLAASFRAARAAGARDSRDAVREHNHWTRRRLRDHAVDCLAGGQLVVVSNREPYMHQLKDGKPKLIVPAGGLVTALDPVLQSCGGLWVAHGAGEADRETADAHGRIAVPPADPRYTLRRVWLTREEEQGYYYGFSNEGLWPLCHLAHERPQFRAPEWEHYVGANRRFADAVLQEVGPARATVLVQDYQLALVPRLLKAARPDLRVGIFWHIPWPNPEAFRICPWREQILRGMLGADVVGFHLQQYCNNFLDTVDRMVEARLDWDHFAVEHQGHRSLVRPFPISVESWGERGVPDGEALRAQVAALRAQHELGDTAVVLGVERIDYTKGLAERFRAVARFLEKAPQYRGRVTFVVLGAPSRTHIRRYRELIGELETLADEINWRFRTDDWKPLHFLATHHDAATVNAFMRTSAVCIVSALHDGMNLVAKEYVAARDGGDGVLILSEFAGAARELSDALIINPYDTEQFAAAIQYALEMEPAEQATRMARMRRVVEENNVYRWAADLLTSLGETGAPRRAATAAEAHGSPA
jgi:trehalose 6-phosphate synthase